MVVMVISVMVLKLLNLEVEARILIRNIIKENKFTMEGRNKAFNRKIMIKQITNVDCCF